ncbi:MAG: hypothetical protein J0L92_41100 [Deltaproteobacteria bacterium]|nr:hypothetical protein [Deltaproteobacteria bacterium]
MNRLRSTPLLPLDATRLFGLGLFALVALACDPGGGGSTADAGRPIDARPSHREGESCSIRVSVGNVPGQCYAACPAHLTPVRDLSDTYCGSTTLFCCVRPRDVGEAGMRTPECEECLYGYSECDAMSTSGADSFRCNQLLNFCIEELPAGEVCNP